MLQPENQPKKYQALFVGIDSGQIKIPKFQRDFVWSKEQTAKLIDSIIKGFPIGTFIFWKTKEELRHVKDIGNAKLPDPPKGDSVFYVLDGQQRITSLYAIQKGIILTKDSKEIDYKDFSIDLSADPDEEDQIVYIEPNGESKFISVYQLLNGSLTEFANEYSEDNYLEKIDIYRNRLLNYDFSTIVIADYPIDIACDIFTRINTGGTQLTLFEIMVAKTFDQKKEFDLAKEYEFLIDNNGVSKDLEDADYDTIPASVILQCISAHLCRQIRRRDILKLKKTRIIKDWPIIKEGIFTAVDYFRTYLRIPVSRLLPYNILLVPFTYFFIHNNGEKPTKLQNQLLTQYFWWASLSNRFSSGAEGKIAADLKRINAILKNEIPSYKKDEMVNVSLDEIKVHWFSTGDAFCKAILCLYAYHEPKSFFDNAIVKIDNSWLKVAFSKNYHHFFPKAYLRKKGIQDLESNVILNITIVDDYLNKRKIGAKSPSKYMKEFKQSNKELKKTMKSHLIGDMKAFGIWTDNYDLFLQKRGEKVIKEINKRLYPKLKQ